MHRSILRICFMIRIWIIIKSGHIGEKSWRSIWKKWGIELKPGAIEILTYLKEKGIHRAISTANDIERAEKYLKKIGLYGYF